MNIEGNFLNQCFDILANILSTDDISLEELTKAINQCEYYNIKEIEKYNFWYQDIFEQFEPDFVAPLAKNFIRYIDYADSINLEIPYNVKDYLCILGAKNRGYLTQSNIEFIYTKFSDHISKSNYFYCFANDFVTPSWILEDIFYNKNPDNECKNNLANNPSTPEKILDILMQDESNHYFIARNNMRTMRQSERLRFLSQSLNSNIRISVSTNKVTPKDALVELLSDDTKLLINGKAKTIGELANKNLDRILT
jgi:hypothetical protein